MTNHHSVVSTALASALSQGLLGSAAAADQKKYFGITKAGHNDFVSLAGTHGCSGEAKVDNDPGECRDESKGACKSLQGRHGQGAKAKMAMAGKH